MTGVGATSLSQPSGAAMDPSGGVYLADTFNHRVLYFPPRSSTASVVYGQGGSFTSNAAGLSASSLSSPVAVVLDASNGLYST
jgi:hypothetical protein